jgi:hypothetical protein
MAKGGSRFAVQALESQEVVGVEPSTAFETNWGASCPTGIAPAPEATEQSQQPARLASDATDRAADHQLSTALRPVLRTVLDDRPCGASAFLELVSVILLSAYTLMCSDAYG